MNKKYEDLIQEYYEFKSNQNKKNKEKLLKALKDFNFLKNKFRTSIDNVFVRNEKK